MNIAILGGTGKEGAGLGARWALAGHSIIIGSRDAARAEAKAGELRGATRKAVITGDGNAAAAARGEIVVIAVPADGLAAILPDTRSACQGKVVISTVVPLTFGGGRLFTPPPEGSAAEQVQRLLPEARVVAAFHHIAAHELAATEHAIECDLLMCGNDREAKEVVVALGATMGLRAIDVGPLTNAGPLEGITAVLATINRRYKLKNSGIKITGL
jgi:8-hydroxy-5-deazaflavin:NADPH oxidoreductase